MGILLSRERWICARVVGEALGVGCGDNEVEALLEREGHRVATADPGEAATLPFDDESFDTVLLGGFLAEWTSRERPLAEARRVLRPGGRLVVAVPYSADPGEDGSGVSLQGLLGELGELAIGETAIVDGRLCVVAERRRERGRAAAWRRALGVAEERLAGSERAAAALAASVAGLEAGAEREQRALADARGNVERLETALAAALHERDLQREAARLAGEGVAGLGRRLERQRRDGERELFEAERERAEVERALADARGRLEARGEELERNRVVLGEARRELEAANARLEAHGRQLKTAQLGVESRDRRLEARDRRLEARDAEIERLRTTAREGERKLALGEARLEKAQQRAERFRSSLVALREGRAYKLMRVLWRLRRPFRRASRVTPEQGVAGDEQDPSSQAGPPPQRSPAPRAQRPARKLQPGARLRVASILDEMSAACFAPECELVPLTLKGWREQLDERRPDLLLVESAWSGNGGEWQYRIAQYPRRDLTGLPALRDLIDGCRERGIPTAFWNKEDPVHFERFAEAASLFDHVFTTDVGCVERYRALPGERSVAPLPFAAQPRIHNPAAVVSERSASPCFAGAWYRDRHPDRRRTLEALLDAARPHGLVIYDRRFGGDDGAFGFPERFAPHVLGRLPYERILGVYKSHRVFLNANSVADSPTMCSRRVFELAACDTAILSTPSAALAALLGEGAVEEAGDEVAAVAALERLLGDEGERTRRTRAARRAVFARHTYADRLATIAAAAGLDARYLRRPAFAREAAAPPNGDGARHPWLLALQPGVALSERALADLAAATAFADADVIGAPPARNGDPAVENRLVTDVDPRALLLRRELVEARGRPAGSPEQLCAQMRRWSDDGVRIYAADADLLPPRDAPVPIGPR
jgi:spore maturation protein CgeB/SAM-dependent methyltransferase